MEQISVTVNHQFSRAYIAMMDSDFNQSHQCIGEYCDNALIEKSSFDRKGIL